MKRLMQALLAASVIVAVPANAQQYCWGERQNRFPFRHVRWLETAQDNRVI